MKIAEIRRFVRIDSSKSNSFNASLGSYRDGDAFLLSVGYDHRWSPVQ